MNQQLGKDFSLKCAVILALFGAMMLAGCKSTPSTEKPDEVVATRPAVEASNSNTDPCAMRLHDLCGPLLMYYSVHHRLPRTLDVLKKMPGFEEQVKLTCPVSGRPYTYSPIGIEIRGQDARAIVYDSDRSHAGMRWVIAIVEPQGDEALVTKVISLPESHFSLNLSR